MDHQAHGLRLDHPVFRTPLTATFEFTEHSVPEQYAGKKSVLYPDGVGEVLRLTRFENERGYWNPTLVNHAGFFTDVPGFENLAEGHSAKVLGSLALARQGRYFYWGFSIDPERLTAPARKVFVNTLHYMAPRRGEETVRFVCKPRQILSTYLDLHVRKPDYKRGIEEHFPGSLTDEARAGYVGTKEGCAAWLAENLPYVYSGKSERHSGTRYETIFDVDADAKALRTPNAERKSLEKWIALAGGGEGPDRERALRCLERYVPESLRPADGDYAAFYAEHGRELFFVESTGFWWQRVPELRRARGR